MERLRPGDPEQIGPWQIVNRLGAGGMGIVYLGTNGTRSAAIKIVRDFLLEDPVAKTRLAREVDSLKKVRSEFVAEIVGSDIEASPAWIATNYVDGPSVKTAVDNEGPLKEREWFEFAEGLISALESIHSVGVIHRDIKPSNILLSPTGPRIIDFGISFSKDATALTKTGTVAGTPNWFSPEQFTNKDVSNKLDIFAAGSVLYFAATGKSPWGKEDASVAQIMHGILNDQLDLQDLTPNQNEVIRVLTNKNPKERASATDALTLIRNLKLNVSDESDTGKFKRLLGFKSRGSKIFYATSLIIISAVIYGALNYLPSSSNQVSTNFSASPKPALKTYWSVSIKGEDKSQDGEGDSFKFYVCDQAVMAKSLRIKELTNPPLEKAPKAQVMTGDARCGKEFDTIEITGFTDTSKDKRNFVLAGTTQTGFIIQYEFELTITRK